MSSSNIRSQNYFEILDVPINASQQDINNAYLKLIKLSKFNKSIDTYLINEAYNVLKNPLERYHYTCSLKALQLNDDKEAAINKLYEDKHLNKLILENEEVCIDEENKKIKPIECKEESINFENSLEQLKEERNKQIQYINKERENQFGGKPPDEKQILNDIQNQSNFDKFLLNDDNNDGLKSAFDNVDEDGFTDAGYTLLEKIEQIDNINKMFVDNRTKMDAAIKSGNIDEFMRLRAEEKKIITKY